MLMDEVHINEDLVFSKETGALLGFVNLGDMNSHLLEYEYSIGQTSIHEHTPANSMMVFMVQGLFSAFSFLHAQFLCRSVTGRLFLGSYLLTGKIAV